MALQIIQKDNEKIQVELNNGDFKALNEIIKEWKFKNEESALRFAIATLYMTKRGKLYSESENGFSTLIPTDEITINMENASGQ